MSEEASESEHGTSGGQERRPDAVDREREEDAQPPAGEADERGFGGIALRGAVVGAAVGAGVGAAVAVAKAVRPDQAESAKQAIADAAREVGTEAVRAAGGALTARPVSELLNAGKGDNGKTTEAVKQAAKEAGVAAASAAGDRIAAMREGRREVGER